MRKNIALVLMAIALVCLGGYEVFRYYKQHNSGEENAWKVSSRYNGVRGTSNTMISRRADGYAGYAPNEPEFLFFCPEGQEPNVVIDTGEPLESDRSDFFNYRFDGDAPKQEFWRVASVNKAVYPDSDFAKEAIRHNGVWVEFQYYGSESKRPIHFNLDGLAQMFEQNCTTSRFPEQLRNSTTETGGNTTSVNGDGAFAATPSNRAVFASQLQDALRKQGILINAACHVEEGDSPALVVTDEGADATIAASEMHEALGNQQLVNGLLKMGFSKYVVTNGSARWERAISATQSEPEGHLAVAPQPASDALTARLSAKGFIPVNAPVIVPADNGGTITLQRGRCASSSGRGCEKVFIAVNEKVIGADTLNPSWGIQNIEVVGTSEFKIEYRKSETDSSGVTVLYKWDGKRLLTTGNAPTHPR